MQWTWDIWFYASLNLRLCSGISNRILSLQLFLEATADSNQKIFMNTFVVFVTFWQFKLITGCPCRCHHMTCQSERWTRTTVHMWIQKNSWTRSVNKFLCKSQVSGLKSGQKCKVLFFEFHVHLSQDQLRLGSLIHLINSCPVFLMLQFDWVG